MADMNDKRQKRAAGTRRPARPDQSGRTKKTAGHMRPAQRSAQTPPSRRRVNVGLVVALACITAAILTGIILSLTQCNKNNTATSQAESSAAQTASSASNNGSEVSSSSSATDVDKDSWELTLVNRTHPLPENWEIKLADVADSKQVDARIADQFNQMIADCKAAGYDDVFVNQAYRSHEDQQAIWDEFYNEYLAEGYSEKEAYELTGQSVAVPGTSEHELGLAADICSINFDETYNAPIQTWLRENGHKYGFIQRYPTGKEAITGTKNENWHFRYVGVEAATEMYESGQVLEEYLGEVGK